MVDAVLWHVPLAGRLSRDRSMAEVCRFLADTSRAGVPLPEALEQAEGLHINTRAREQVASWRLAILAGRPVAQAAEEAGMPRLVRGFLDNAAAPRAGGGENVANVFDFLARYYAGRFSRLWILLKAAYEPAALLLLGLLVGFVTYALFYPLVVLIEAVIGNYPQVGL
jgi:type II secretory pathway component PulF